VPLSVVRTFCDPDEFSASVRGATLETTITERGNFDAKQVRIDLHRLWMQRLSTDLRRIYHGDGWGGRAVITFHTQTGPSVLHSGVELHANAIARFSMGQSYYNHSAGPTSQGSMSLPVADMVSIGAVMAGSDLTPPRDTLIFTPRPDTVARLQRLHAAAAHLAEAAPEIIANPDAAYGLEQALIEAMVGCLGNNEAREDSVAQRQHELIMRRFRRVVEENPDQPLYIPELCKAIGVSERTLRVCCREQLGVGPKRYLLFRRLHLARRALRMGLPDTTTVTEIATRYGFWHFGRFAGEYQSLFAEPPSSTLYRPAE